VDVVTFILYEVILLCVMLSYWWMAIDQIVDKRISQMKEVTVSELRKCGHKVRVHHHRRLPQAPFNNQTAVAARGGKTVVEVTTPDGRTLIGIARCSKKENFNKKLGVRIALGRALKNEMEQQVS